MGPDSSVCTPASTTPFLFGVGSSFFATPPSDAIAGSVGGSLWSVELRQPPYTLHRPTTQRLYHTRVMRSALVSPHVCLVCQLLLRLIFWPNELVNVDAMALSIRRR